MIRKVWGWLKRPSRMAWSLVAVLGGVVMAGGLLTVHLALETTGSVEFCVSCHSMTIPYEEYQTTVHYQNTSGVPAGCPDCHVAEKGIAYYMDKVIAGKDLFYWMTGKIATAEDYETHRLEMAEIVWAKMEATDSRECRSCHDRDAMLIDQQTTDAQKQHVDALASGETCIDCHKGIAHKMPDLAARAREIAAAFMEQPQPLTSDHVWTKSTTPLLAEGNADGAKLGTILPGVSMTRLETSGDYVKVRLSGWQAGDVVRGQYALFGQRILNISISASALDRITYGKTEYYSDGDQDWIESSLEGWVEAAKLTSDGATLWSVADATYVSQCAVCHSVHAPETRPALGWVADVEHYGEKTSLTAEEERLVLRYLQLNSSDTKDLASDL